MKISPLKYLKVIFLLSLCSYFVSAQDAHFTQYYQNAALINPSLIGNFKGLFKVGMNYRDQWRPALNQPYSTFTATGESVFDVGDKNNPDIVGIGIMFLSDKISAFDLNTNQISLSGNYRKLLNAKNNQYIGLGFQAGVITKTLNYEKLTFGDQFNSVDAFTLDTKELLPGNNFGFFDFALGLNYSISSGPRNNFNFGIAGHHLTQPNISFYAKETTPNNDLDFNAFLDARWAAHASINMPLRGPVDIEPRVLYMKQDQSNMVSIGSLFKYKNPTSEGRTLYGGPSLRFSNRYDGIGAESLMLTFGYDYNGLNLGFSYDHNLPDLVNYRNGLGTFEFTLNYIGQFQNDDQFCPKF
jgi:type IX secretion system PorP/SprF family membrane protein